jgi:hypothetical protein
MSDSHSTTRPPVAGMDVLDRIDRSLEMSLARTPELAPSAGPPEPTQFSLAGLDERLAAWQLSLEYVEKQAATSTERLAAEHAALSEWLDRLGRVRADFTRWSDTFPPR